MLDSNKEVVGDKEVVRGVEGKPYFSELERTGDEEKETKEFGYEGR